MPPTFLTGVIAPLFTPCFPDRTIDYRGGGALVDYLADTGAVRSVFARSGMGKMFTFTIEETERFAEAVVERARARKLGALIGCAGEWREKESGRLPDPERYTAQSVGLAQRAKRLGADAAVLILPAALLRDEAPAEETTFAYVRTVHDAVPDLPLVLYQAPGLPARIRLTPDTLRRLRTLPRVAGAKVSSGSDAVMEPLLDSVRGSDFALICGDEGYWLRGLERGATGVIGEGACAYPELLAAIERLWRAGRRDEAQRAQETVLAALKVKGELDGTPAWLQRMVLRGARSQSGDRSGNPPYPIEKIKALDSAVDALVAPFVKPG